MGNHVRKSKEYKSGATSLRMDQTEEETINWQMEDEQLLPDAHEENKRETGPENIDEATSMFSEYEKLEEAAEGNKGPQIWQYLVDILIGSTFRPYIYWTGNVTEFKIENPTVVFTELFKIRQGELPSTMLDPFKRWIGNLLDEHAVNWYLQRMQHDGANIKRSGKHCYYFDHFEPICNRLKCNLPTILAYFREAKLRTMEEIIP